MNRITQRSFLMLLTLWVMGTISAQEIEVDERELVGSWTRIEVQGDFGKYPHEGGPLSIRFKDSMSHSMDSLAVLYYYNTEFNYKKR